MEVGFIGLGSIGAMETREADAGFTAAVSLAVEAP